MRILPTADYRLPQTASPFLRFHIEHVEASQHVLDDSESNLCLACPRCNLQKEPNLTTLIEPDRQLVRLFHPRRDQWDEHFEVIDGRIVGKTDTGIGLQFTFSTARKLPIRKTT